MIAPTVSVIIPTYNRATFVQQAIQSVLAQTFREFEVIVVDDASSDDTSEAIHSIYDARLQYVKHEENRGGSAARNTGIAVARGHFIAFLDSDDFWLPQKLEKQLDVLDGCSERVGLVYTNYEAVNEEGQSLGHAYARHRGSLHDELLVRNCVGASTVLVRRACFERLGGFDESLPSCQDWDMWIRISEHYDFELVPEVLVIYRAHTDPERITNSAAAVLDGYRLLAQKHLSSESPQSLPIRSQHLFRLGKHFCNAGNYRIGRGLFFQAWKLAPSNLKIGIYLLASMFGKSIFTLLERTKNTALDWLIRGGIA